MSDYVIGIRMHTNILIVDFQDAELATNSLYNDIVIVARYKNLIMTM